jgi:hypothetical protein
MPAHTTPGLDVRQQCLPQFRGILASEIDLVLTTVNAE